MVRIGFWGLLIRIIGIRIGFWGLLLRIRGIIDPQTPILIVKASILG